MKFHNAWIFFHIPGIIDRSVVSESLALVVGGDGRVPIVILIRVLFLLVRVIGLILSFSAFIRALRDPYRLAERQAYHRNAQQNDQQQWLPRPHLLVSLNTARLRPPVERSRLLSPHVSPRLTTFVFLDWSTIDSRPLQPYPLLLLLFLPRHGASSVRLL